MARNWALVIGINGYNPLNFTPLKYAKRDAEMVKTFFADLGFEVCCFTDDSPPLTTDSGVTIPTQPSYGNLVTFFEDRFQKPFLKQGDNCWFFFAGHGERHADKDYLMPMDANSRGNKVIAGLLVEQVREWLTRSGADNVILLLDACRNEGGRGTGGIDPTEQRGVITISSCNPTQRAWEVDDLQHGVFTYALLEAMQLPGDRSCATVERLGRYLRDRVPELCQRYGKAPAQTPRISVDPIEKQHFILVPQCARQADIDLMKQEGYRLAFTNKLQLAEQMFFRANVAARGRDSDIIDALTEIRMRMRGIFPNSVSSDNPTAEDSSSRGTAAPATHSFEETTRPTPQPKQLEPEDNLASERNIDYHDLRDLLKAGNWKEADQETYRVMIRAVGKNEGDWFTSEELLNFPCQDLKTIDSLWVKYSKGHFGFSVQKEIWQKCGSPTTSGKEWDDFCVKVGWKDSQNNAYVSYDELKFNPKSSRHGELPAVGFLWVWVGCGGWLGGWLCVDLFSRIETCEL